MRRNAMIFLGGAWGVVLLVLALWAWKSDEDLATRLGAHNLRIEIWAVRCAAVALTAAAEALLMLLVVRLIYKKDAITSILGGLAMLVSMLSAVSAIALGLAGR